MKRRSPVRPPPPDSPAPGDGAFASAGLDPREPFLLPVLLALACRLGLWLAHPLTNEDAYITFRYARNLVLGNGLVYNPDERVMGFSSPLWTVWSALGIRLFDRPESWARAWSLTADLVVLVLVASLLRRVVSRMAAWCFAFFFAAWPFFSAVTVSGMESNLMLALLVLGAALAERGSPATGPVIAALALTRPEGPLAAAAVALLAPWRDRIVAAALTGAGLLALWLGYGTVLPSSVSAKAAIYGLPGPLVGRHWWDWLVPAVLGKTPVTTEGVHLFLLSVLIAPAVVVGAPVVWRARRTALGPIVAGAVAIWLGYAAAGVAFFFWYLFVPLAGFAILASCGLPRLLRGPGVLVAAGMMVLGAWNLATHLYLGRAQTEAADFGAAANYLQQNARIGESVFLEPIGLIGYRNALVVIDEVGLVSPDVARRRAQGAGWYADVVAQRRPDWIVVRHEVVARGASFAGWSSPFRTAAERDSVFARYTLVHSPEPPGDRTMVILKRNP